MPLVPKTDLDGLSDDIPALPGETDTKTNSEDETSSTSVPSVPGVTGGAESENKE